MKLEVASPQIIRLGIIVLVINHVQYKVSKESVALRSLLMCSTCRSAQFFIWMPEIVPALPVDTPKSTQLYPRIRSRLGQTLVSKHWQHHLGDYLWDLTVHVRDRDSLTIFCRFDKTTCMIQGRTAFD